MPSPKRKKTARRDELNPRQSRFIKEYLAGGRNGLNGKQAAIRAGYSPASAEVTASKLLRVPKVAAAIAKATAKVTSKLEVSAERTISELARLAYADLGEAFDSEGRFLPLHEMPEDIRRALAGVEVEALFEGFGEEREKVGTVRKLKCWDKHAALRTLAQYQGLLVEKHEHALDKTLEQLVLESMKPRGGA